ncbi:MAG: hypothetical protein V7K14_08275 [Nostoc sp.]|uniref:hypothetical protein n=1 Tax=Nostoc sp. TaxID=1180 RepID=UPI002FFC11D5
MLKEPGQALRDFIKILSRTSGNTVGVSLIGAVFGALIASMSAGADVSVAPPEAIVAGFQGTFRFAALILCGAAVASVLRISKRQGSRGVGEQGEQGEQGSRGVGGTRGTRGIINAQ